jgi:hypothetical protein
MPTFSKIILHIGTEKTASTSIQSHLALNHDHLLAAGYVYPREFGDNGHFDLTIYAAPEELSKDLRLTLHGRSATRRGVYRNFGDYFRQTLSDNYHCDGKVLLLSNEHLATRLREPQDVQKIKTLLQSLSNDIRILVYLRSQESYLTSLYNTAILTGGISPFREWILPERDYLNWAKQLDMWAEEFGRSNLLARSFAEAAKAGIVEDFVEICELPDFSTASTSPRLNLSLSPKRLELIRRVNVALKTVGIDRSFLFAKAARKLLTYRPAGNKKLELSEKDVIAIRQTYEADNFRLASEYGVSL